jgi:hypothetical protein
MGGFFHSTGFSALNDDEEPGGLEAKTGAEMGGGPEKLSAKSGFFRAPSLHSFSACMISSGTDDLDQGETTSAGAEPEDDPEPEPEEEEEEEAEGRAAEEAPDTIREGM